MKTKITIIFAVAVTILAVLAFVLVPYVFPKNEAPAPSSATSTVAPISSAPTIYTPAEALALCDAVVTGTVIKADVAAEGVEYTLQIGRVYKGRNYTSMGYAFISGPQTLELAKTYLFAGITGNEKYHYYAPFTSAPWVYLVEEQVLTAHASNGKESLISGMSGLTLEEIKTICDGQKNSSK